MRFEDMYGLADIFCKAYNMEYVRNKLTVTHTSGALDLKVGIGADRNVPLSSYEFRKRLPLGLNEDVYKWIPVRWESETVMLLPNINNAVKLVNARTWE